MYNVGNIVDNYVIYLYGNDISYLDFFLMVIILKYTEI